MRNYTRLFAASAALLTTLAGPANAQTILDRIAAEILSGKFGISTNDIAKVQSASGLSMYEIAPVLSVSSHGNTRADRVWELRRQGLGWGQVADRIGMHPGTFNKLRVAGAFDSAPIWNNALRSRFAVSGPELAAAQRRGASPQDCIAAILIGKSTGRNPQAVLDEHGDERGWESMRSKHKVDFGDWKKSATHSTTNRHAVSGKAKHKGHGIGKGNGNGKGNGKGGG